MLQRIKDKLNRQSAEISGERIVKILAYKETYLDRPASGDWIVLVQIKVIPTEKTPEKYLQEYKEIQSKSYYRVVSVAYERAYNDYRILFWLDPEKIKDTVTAIRIFNKTAR